MEMRRLGTGEETDDYRAGEHRRPVRAGSSGYYTPAANILVADETTFQAENRQKAMGQIATGNWDAVLISHDAFGLLPVDDNTFNSFLQKEIDALEDAIRQMSMGKADKKITKELEKSKKRPETKLRNNARCVPERKDDLAHVLSELGIDALFRGRSRISSKTSTS